MAKTVPSLWTVQQSHFEADEPSHFGAVRPTRPRAPEPCARSSRTPICAAITGGGAPPGHQPPRLARARRDAARLPRRRQRGLRPDRRRRLDRDPPRRRPDRPRRPGRRHRPAAARARRRRAAARPPLRLDVTATAPDLAAFPRRAWSAALRRCWRRCPTRRSTTATRAATTSCGPSSRPISCGCAGWSRRRTDVVIRAATRRGCG